MIYTMSYIFINNNYNYIVSNSCSEVDNMKRYKVHIRNAVDGQEIELPDIAKIINVENKGNGILITALESIGGKRIAPSER